MAGYGDIEDCWLDQAWGFVQGHLPRPPAKVVEVGCGQLGGFVRALRVRYYDAVGVDPKAPDEDAYLQVAFEDYEAPEPVDTVIASTSLHHLADLGGNLDHIAGMLRPGGTLVVVEYGWERMDETTAGWCFDRLGPPGGGDEDSHGWLYHLREQYLASGRPWDAFLEDWARHDGETLHRGREVVAALQARFTTTFLADGPYLACKLPGTPLEDELAAIAAGRIQATGIRWVGTRQA